MSKQYLDKKGLETLWGKIKAYTVFVKGDADNSAVLKGGNNVASSINSSAFGLETKASGEASHAEGYNTHASGDYSHTEGHNTIAEGNSSHAEGLSTIASGDYSHAEGKYNKSNTNTLHSVGIGVSDTDRKNAHEIMDDGKHYIYGVGGYDGTNPDTSYDLATYLPNMVNITYDELVALRNNSKLVPGQQYRITDYVTTTIQENTQSAGHQFDIIVTADDENTLNEVARACKTEFDLEKYKDAFSGSWAEHMSYVGIYEYEGKEYHLYESEAQDLQMLMDFNSQNILEGIYLDAAYPYTLYPAYCRQKEESWGGWNIGHDFAENIAFKYNLAEDTYFFSSNLVAWQIWYCLDNDTSRFAWADTENGKGVIYRMIDEFNNDCPYDFKNIQFKRNLNFDDRHAHFSNDGEETWVYTFAGQSYNIHYNKWSDMLDGSLESPFGHMSDENTSTFHDNTIKPYIIVYNGNEIYTECGIVYLNDIVLLGYWEEIGSDNSGDAPYYYAYCCHNNSFDYNCYNNSLGNNCSHNSFGNDCDNNSFGNDCDNNSFGNDCDNNSFGNNCDNNSFGVNYYNNRFGYNCANNSFGDDCYSNSFGNGCIYNSFGNYCNTNRFDHGCSYNSFGNGCYSNSFGNGCYSNSFGNGCYSNSFDYNCYNNSFGNRCSYNSFGTSCDSNSFGNGCNYNSFRTNNSKTASLKAYCYYNHFDDGCSYNVIWNADTASSSYRLQNININRGVTGTASSYNYINIDVLNSVHEIEVYNDPTGKTYIDSAPIALTTNDIDLIWDSYFIESDYGSASAVAADESINSIGIGDYDENIIE